jgi:hypothetical protein
LCLDSYLHYGENYRMRRVKYYETKPNCLHCQRFGRDCDSYSLPQSPTKKAVSKRYL